MVNGFLLHGERPESFREGRVVLIAKPGGSPSDPSAYRPITLLNTDYKIVASILARRMSHVLPCSSAQTCSVPGRSIFSSLALTRDLFDFASRTGISGCFISVDQAKAFDRVEHRYMLGVLGLYGFPSEYISCLRLAYSNVTARLLVNGRLSERFTVTRGIRQGFPWSPSLFALCLDPLLRRVAACPSIHGFPLPGQGQIKVSAYADDVSLFLRDEDSYRAFTGLFLEYGELSGSRLNKDKSRALRFGSLASDLAGDVQWVKKVRVLVVVFHGSGEVARETWKGLLDTADKRINIASTFKLSLSERSYIIKSCVSAAFFYVARVVRPPRDITRRLATKFGSFFWASKTESVARALLHLPRSMGVFSLPCLNTMSSVLALRGVWELVDDDEYPGQALLRYFLGTARLFFYDEPITGPTAVQPPAFYRYVAKTLRGFQSANPGLEIRASSATDICEKLAIGQLNDRQKEKSRGARWQQLTSAVLPADVRDFGWLRGWRALPTCDRLAAFGVVRSSRCPQCGRTETLEHALFECRVAATFWVLLSRMFELRLGAHTKSKDPFVSFLLCVGAFVVWRQRGVAALQARPQRAMYPLLWRVRKMAIEHLQHELVALGEESFLMRWSTRFIKVANNTVQWCVVPY